MIMMQMMTHGKTAKLPFKDRGQKGSGIQSLFD
jgi:hypothetical protein